MLAKKCHQMLAYFCFQKCWHTFVFRDCFVEGLSLWNFVGHEYLAHWLCRQGSLTEPTRVEVGPDGHISAAVLNAKAAESRFTLEVEFEKLHVGH